MRIWARGIWGPCILLGLLSVQLPVEARVTRNKDTYPLQRLSLAGITDIKIVGVKGTLRLHGRPARGEAGQFLGLRVQHSGGARFADWQLSVDRRGHTLFFEVFNVAYGTQWKQQVRAELWPEFNLDLEGPSRPTSVAWREGHLEVEDWTADLEISLLKGGVRVVGGSGPLKLEPVQATVDVEGHHGLLTLKGQTGEVRLVRTDGDVRLNWLSGEVRLLECSGKLKVEASDAQVLVHGGRGDLDLQVAQGSVRITEFNGSVRGRGRETRWDVTASAPSDVDVKSGSGPVDVHWKDGGGRFFLTSAHGPIQFPHGGFLAEARQGGQKVVEGRKSAQSMGQVFVRSGSGAILCCQ